MLSLIHLCLNSVGRVVDTPFVQFVFTKPLCRQSHIAGLAPVVLAAFLDQLDGGILEHEGLLVLMRGPGFAVVIGLTIGMFKCIPVGSFKGLVVGYLEVHAGSV